ncbi:hypothetical protein EPUS_04695 [Endocarpon pusillum Z07020]|uniref:Uncharacterized protein n=1 Tax=Endocarpon pusillum (strain Z07020 / HMAS-L-300199) TaxID=1263415 RepID=U1FUV9_ENDPU|nr:uncharacterized protein EPUS_04695 [Endocarpon pusillum Z07020]ERF68597.1 hypothetical protein EPUS_04695 [Endocarpon pusillum Z07020]
MPTLRQLRCEVEWGNTQTPFPEYGTTYGDGVVETYIAIPEHPQPFAVRLRSRKYIAEGLAMLIFMDGDYQCNRNRLGLQRPNPGVPQNMTEIDLRVRQRERALGYGHYLGREWRFDKHNILPLDKVPPNMDRQHFEALGTIDVFVLRCRSKEDIEPSLNASSDVDDSVLQTSEPSSSETLTEEPAPPSDTENAQVAEPEADLFLGFMNDGAADIHQFGLDGEGPGPAEQKAWSWNAPYPLPVAPGPSSGYAHTQPPPAQTQPYIGYAYPPGFSQPWQPGPAITQDQSNAQRPQRHVHFNDQLPQQPSGYGAPGPPYGPQSFSANAGQSQGKEHPPQPQSHGQTQQTESHQVPGHAPGHNNYANPSLAHAGMLSSHGQVGGYSLAPDPSYPPPMSNYPSTIPSYQPIGYGAPAYSGWSTSAGYLPYGQPNWQGQHVPGSSYLTPPNYAAPYQTSHQYPHPQFAYPVGPAAQVPLSTTSHPGGGVWGPPPSKPGSQDPTQDGTNQLDGQETTGNAGGQPNDNNSQGCGGNDTNQAQAGDSSWNNNDTGGGQTDNWNTTATQTEAPTNDWNQSSNNTGQANNPDSSWNENPNYTHQVQDSWNNNANSTQNQDWNANNTQNQDWNTNANTCTQAPEPWDTAPATAQANQTSPTTAQHGTAATPAQFRPLNGPHGRYYGEPHKFIDEDLRPDAGEEPPYDVPEDIPTTHQVKPGPAFNYVHKRRSPEYLDTVEEPYARFIFKYRTKEADDTWDVEQIERAIGIKIEDEPTGDEEKRKLQEMDKNEIIDMLLRAKYESSFPDISVLGIRQSDYPSLLANQKYEEGGEVNVELEAEAKE